MLDKWIFASAARRRVSLLSKAGIMASAIGEIGKVGKIAVEGNSNCVV